MVSMMVVARFKYSACPSSVSRQIELRIRPHELEHRLQVALELHLLHDLRISAWMRATSFKPSVVNFVRASCSSSWCGEARIRRNCGHREIATRRLPSARSSPALRETRSTSRKPAGRIVRSALFASAEQAIARRLIDILQGRDLLREISEQRAVVSAFRRMAGLASTFRQASSTSGKTNFGGTIPFSARVCRFAITCSRLLRDAVQTRDVSLRVRHVVDAVDVHQERRRLRMPADTSGSPDSCGTGSESPPRFVPHPARTGASSVASADRAR